MPITRKVRNEDSRDSESDTHDHTCITFIGDEFIAPCFPEWNAEQAVAALGIEQISFTHTDGNCQGYAKQRQIAMNRLAQLPHKTLFHEAAHLCWLRSYVGRNS